jgi:hypothetical protein
MPNQINITEDTSWERMWSGQVAALLALARPWLVLGLASLAGYIAHRVWGHVPAAPWAVMGLTLATVGLGSFAWATSRLAPVGRAHSALTVSGALAWLTVATITGPGEAVTGGLLGIVGGTLALSWNIRYHARHAPAAGSADPAGRLAGWFKDAAQAAGVPGARLQVHEIGATRAAGKIVLPPGEKVSADVANRARYIEAGMGLPPNALNVTQDDDRADHAGWTLSDPRIIRRPIPWPGPSAPGASIARPLRPGLWQDGVPVAHTLPGHHVHAMGASGAGKSIGGAWNYSAEIITRYDVALAAADITKGEQTFGPLRPALHRFETDRDGARDLLERTHGKLKDRTDYLADHGLQKWHEGCGLTYLVVWLEETPDIYDALTGKGQERFISTAKALRSAGGTLVCSLQRTTWDQLPTIVRGQMASLCFGLNDPADARYGLSERQQDAGAEPAQWGIDNPGMAYLHAPDTPAGRIAMALRTFAWGEDDGAISAHAAQYPAAARPVDPITAEIVGANPPPASPGITPPARPVAVLTNAPHGDAEDQDDDNPEDDLHDAEDAEVRDEYLTTENPTPELAAGIDDPIEVQDDDEEFEFAQAEPVTPEAAREIFAAQLAEWQAEGRTSFAPKDFPFIGRPGMGRAWIQARLREALDDLDSPVWRDGDDGGGTYRLREPLAPLPA